ncbi:hypothetical protein BDZ97DRAFT_1769950 [Flammula alnicola]|nr:hypothetical protein BDZ97DRAFT_1769950 [Flammula alnicola]
MASNNQADASNTPPAYNQNLRDIWDGRSHTTPEEQVTIKEARFTALFNAAHNLDTAQIRLQDEYPIPEFTAFMQAFLDYHDAVPEGTVHGPPVVAGLMYLRASRGAGMGGLGRQVWMTVPFGAGLMEMMSGVVFWVLLVVGGGFGGEKIPLRSPDFSLSKSVICAPYRGRDGVDLKG